MTKARTISRIFFAGEGDDAWLEVYGPQHAVVARLRSGGVFQAHELVSPEGKRSQWINIDHVDTVIEVEL